MLCLLQLRGFWGFNMEWKKLLSAKRRGEYKSKRSVKAADLRSEFEKDYHRIIVSASFRRLQDKTQVFPLDKSDFIRTRLTHSLEVSSIAKSLGQNISEHIIKNKLDPDFSAQQKSDVSDILQCAGLIHDIGNPPFGHFGEEAIREWFRVHLPRLHYQGQAVSEILSPQMQADFYNFEGNAQALRLVSKLHFLVNENGMNLTYALLNTIIKYPVSSLGLGKVKGNVQYKKMGYFYSEEDLYKHISMSTGAINCRHPLAYALEAADDIAYCTADIEDAFKKGHITYDILLTELTKRMNSKYKENFMIKTLTDQYQKAIDNDVEDKELFAVQNWLVRMQGALINSATKGFVKNYNAIMAGTYKYDIFHGTDGEQLTKALGSIAYDYAFTSQAILKMEIAEGQMLNFLMNKFVSAFLLYDTPTKLGMIEEKYITLISGNYKQIYHTYSEGKSEQEKLYLRLLLVTDFVCGMTDSYAKNMYQELNGID